MKLDIIKERKLIQDEKLRIIVESIKNQFDVAFSYYENMKEKYPELENLIEI